jgi:hypothetical protein
MAGVIRAGRKGQNRGGAGNPDGPATFYRTGGGGTRRIAASALHGPTVGSYTITIFLPLPFG